jgi:hypothetical protein
MKSILFLLLLLNSFFSYADCPSQTVCRSGSCYQEEIPNCRVAGNVKVISPSVSETDYQNWYKKDNQQIYENKTSTTSSNPPKNKTYNSPSCAENGSCYGEMSSVNGLPKTTHVQGYYRKDGTYVRGHYRSKGR